MQKEGNEDDLRRETMLDLRLEVCWCWRRKEKGTDIYGGKDQSAIQWEREPVLALSSRQQSPECAECWYVQHLKTQAAKGVQERQGD